MAAGSNMCRSWRYYGDVLEEGPTDIRQIGLPSTLSDLDAAFVWGGNRKTYFFKGNNYWRYNEYKKAVDGNYPKSIIAWGKGKLPECFAFCTFFFIVCFYCFFFFSSDPLRI